MGRSGVGFGDHGERRSEKRCSKKDGEELLHGYFLDVALNTRATYPVMDEPKLKASLHFCNIL
jgi:hypothetical protein